MPSNRDLGNPKFCNWVKGGIALKYFTEGLKTFVDEQFKEQHTLILNQIENQLRSFSVEPETCTRCSMYNLLPCFPHGTCRSGRKKCQVHTGTDEDNRPQQCPNGFCPMFLDKIKTFHRRKPSWHNTVAQKWSLDHIEVAKCFLSQNEANRNVHSIDDVDTIGLMDMVENNIPIENCLSGRIKTTILPECKKVRQVVFHTESFELSDDDVYQHITYLISFLEDRKKLCADPHAQTAVVRLKQLRDGNITVTLQDELEVREEVMIQIQSEKAQASANLKNVKVEHVGLLRKEVQQNLRDVEEQHQYVSMQLSMYQSNVQQNFQAMGLEHSLQFASMADVQDRIKENLIEFSKKVKGEVKEIIVETLDEISQENVDIKAPGPDSVEQFARIQEHLKRLDEKADKLEKSLNSMKTYYSKFEKLEHLHKQDMDRQQNLSDYLRRKSNLQDNLRKKYENLRSRINIPFNTQILVDVMQIYTEQVIKAIPMLESTPVSSVPDPVTCYRDIFCKDGKLCRKVVLIGNIGHGKTMYCNRLLQDWVEAVRKAKTKNYSSLNDDQRFLSQFSLLFYIELENVAEECTVFEMISKQIFGSPVENFRDDQRKNYMTILEVFDREPSECLIILDGLDKWNSKHRETRRTIHNKHLPIQELSEACTTLITTRHWKWHAIHHTLTTLDIDNTFELCAPEDEMKNAQQLVSILNDRAANDNDKVMIEKFDRFLSKQYISEMSKVPLILHFLIWVIYRYPGLQQSKTELTSQIFVYLFKYLVSWERNRMVEQCASHFLSSTKQNPFQQMTNLPEEMRSNDAVNRYFGLTSKLALFAFKDLLKTGDQSPLILVENEVNQFFQNEEFELALKTGILTQVVDWGVQKTVKLSFICPTLQHFLAALHLAISSLDYASNSVDELLDYCSHEERIYEIENMLQFAFCLVPDLCKKLTLSVCKLQHKEMGYQQSSDRMKYTLLKFLREFETYYRDTPKNCSFYMENLKLSVNDFTQNQEAITLKLFQSNATNIKKFIAITEITDLQSFENLERISRHILQHLALATSLVNLHLTHIILVDEGCALSYLRSLEFLQLENVTGKKGVPINMTKCTVLHTLKLTCLKDIHLTISSTALKILALKDCIYVHVEFVSDFFLLPFNLCQKVSLKELKSLELKCLTKCTIDFQNASMNIDLLILEKCIDCKVLLDQSRVAEEDKESSNDSYLLSYLQTLPSIWSDTSKLIVHSSIENVLISGDCQRIKIRAFTIVSKCSVRNCLDSEIMFQSNVSDKDTLSEISEVDKSQQCFNVLECVSTNRCHILFRNMPLQLQMVKVTESSNCKVAFDCFDLNMSMVVALLYSTETRSRSDLFLKQERLFCLNHVEKSLITFANSHVVLDTVSLEFCKGCVVHFEQNENSATDSPGVVDNKDVLLARLKCISSSDLKLVGLQEAVIREAVLECCDIEWTNINWKMLESLQVENVPDSAIGLFHSLRGCMSLQNLVCRNLSIGTFQALVSTIPTLQNLKCARFAPVTKGDCEAIFRPASACQGLFSLHCEKVISESFILLSCLTRLTLSSIDGHSFAISTAALPNLKHLKIFECMDLSDSALLALQNLDKKLPSLEQFTISGIQESNHDTTVLKCVSKMPKLKKLTCSQIPTAFLTILQHQNLKRLETFEARELTGRLFLQHLCFLSNLKNLQSVICCRLKTSNVKPLVDTVSDLKGGIKMEISQIDQIGSKALESLRKCTNLKQLVCRDLNSDTVISVLSNLPCYLLESVHMEHITYVEANSRLNGHAEIGTLTFSRVSQPAMCDMLDLFGNCRGVTEVDFAHLTLTKTIIGNLKLFQTLKILKLHDIKGCNFEELGRCVGILRVEELSISDISFHGSVLNLSNAYRLRVIRLMNIFMYPKTWLYFFEKLPRLVDATEIGTLAEFVVVDKVERKHSTSVRKIELKDVCITHETICKVSNLGLFVPANLIHVRDSCPSIYSGSLRSVKKMENSNTE